MMRWIPILLVTAACAGAPAHERGAPSVGVTTLHLMDEARGRKLETEVWYPAPPSSSEHAELYLKIFVGHAARNAAVLAGPPRPLIVLSHGSGSFRQDLAWLAEDLVRAGYIVASASHPSNNYDDEDRLKRLIIWERPQDVSALITRMVEHPGWRMRVDRNRVGAVGFSLGGYTVLQLAGARYDVLRARAHCVAHPDDSVCQNAAGVDRSKIDYAPSGKSYRDERVKAVLALAPAGAPATDPASISQMLDATRIISSRDDTTLVHAYYGGIWQQLLSGKVTIVDGPDHPSFITPCVRGAFLLPIHACKDPPGVDRHRLHAQISDVARTFFAEHLTAPQPAPQQALR